MCAFYPVHGIFTATQISMEQCLILIFRIFLLFSWFGYEKQKITLNGCGPGFVTSSKHHSSEDLACTMPMQLIMSSGLTANSEGEFVCIIFHSEAHSILILFCRKQIYSISMSFNMLLISIHCDWQVQLYNNFSVIPNGSVFFCKTWIDLALNDKVWYMCMILEY